MIDSNFISKHYIHANSTLKFEEMKQHKKLIILFFVIVLFCCIIAPIIKIPLDFLVEKGGFIANAVDYENGQYDFGKVMRRILMFATLVVFLIYRKKLNIGALILSSIKPKSGIGRKFLFGFSMAAISTLIYYLIALSSGAWVVHIDYNSTGVFLLTMIKYLLIGCLVGFIEEAFFRGFVLQSFMEEMSFPIAICVSSLIYSLLHFFRADVYVSKGFQVFVGFTTMIQFFKPLFLQFAKHLPSIIGIFLVGVVFSYAFIQTKSLYLSIGLHSGWIFFMKADSLFVAHVSAKLGWLFGNFRMVTGVLVWIFLLCMIFVIKKIYSNTEAAQGTLAPSLLKE